MTWAPRPSVQEKKCVKERMEGSRMHVLVVIFEKRRLQLFCHSVFVRNFSGFTSFGCAHWCWQRNVSALFLASENGHDKVVELLLSAGSDVNLLVEVSSLTGQYHNSGTVHLSFSIFEQPVVLGFHSQLLAQDGGLRRCYQIWVYLEILYTQEVHLHWSALKYGRVIVWETQRCCYQN